MSRGLLLLVVGADLAAMLTGLLFAGGLRAAFAEPGAAPVALAAAGYACFCAAAFLARRLPHERELLDPGSIGIGGGVVGASALAGTVLLCAAFARGYAGPRPAEALLSVLALTAFVLPSALLWLPDPRQVPARWAGAGELAVVVACDVTSLVMLGFFDATLGAPGPRADAAPALPWPGLVALVPGFLFLCGAPRLLLLMRRFSVPALLVLLASTAVNLAWRFCR